jgi:hypothetical protein
VGLGWGEHVVAAGSDNRIVFFSFDDRSINTQFWDFGFLIFFYFDYLLFIINNCCYGLFIINHHSFIDYCLRFDFSGDTSQKEFSCVAMSPSGQTCIAGLILLFMKLL